MSALALSPDSKLLATGGHNGTALVAAGLVQPHIRDLSTSTSGNSSGEP